MHPLPQNTPAISSQLSEVSLNGQPRLLTFAAREADIVGFAPKALPGGGLDIPDIAEESLRRKVSWVDEAAELAGRSPQLNLLILILEITDDRQGAAQRLAVDLPGMTPEQILGSPHVLLGTPAEMADQLLAHRATFGFSYIVINTGQPDHIDLFAPVIELLSGR